MFSVERRSIVDIRGPYRAPGDLIHFIFLVVSQPLSNFVLPLKMTEYQFEVSSGSTGTLIKLIRNSDNAQVTQLIANKEVDPIRVASHLQSLTDDQFREFFKQQGNDRPKKESEKAPSKPNKSQVWSLQNKPLKPGECLSYCDGPLLFWIKHEGASYLAFSVPLQGQPSWPVVLAELSEKQVDKVLKKEWTLLATVKQAKRYLFVADYYADIFEVQPMPRIPREWLPADVFLN